LHMSAFPFTVKAPEHFVLSSTRVLNVRKGAR